MATSKRVAKAEPERPAPTEEQAAAIDRARARVKARGARIQLQKNLKPDGTNTINLTPPHSDHEGWDAQLRDAFGTGSGAFMRSEVGRLLGIAASNATGEPHPQVTNGLLAGVQGIAPENEMEAMLAVQMVSTHDLAMSMLTKAKATAAAGGNAAVVDSCASLAVKLMRTFTTQTEALSKLRRGGEQKVTVEHVHIHSGGQAIVGQVSVPGRGQIEDGHQAYAPLDPRALVFAPSDPLLCQDAGGVRVPEPCCAGEEAMPNARRGKRQRRTQG